MISECIEQDLVIFNDGSFTKAGSKPATAEWGFVVQPGDGEEAIHEGSGPLVANEAIRYDGLLKPTNNTAELQAIHMCLQWCLDNPGHVHSNRWIVVCPDSTFAITRVSTKGKVKAHAIYVQHLRELLKRVMDTSLLSLSNWSGPAETGNGHPPASPAPRTRTEPPPPWRLRAPCGAIYEVE